MRNVISTDYDCGLPFATEKQKTKGIKNRQGRRCKFPGCTCIMSVYNKDPHFCYPHQRFMLNEYKGKKTHPHIYAVLHKHLPRTESN